MLPAMIASGQGVISDQPKMLFNDEQTFRVVFLNSNGLGADYRFCPVFQRQIRPNLCSLSLDYVKHPKEYTSVVSLHDFYMPQEVCLWERESFFGS